MLGLIAGASLVVLVLIAAIVYIMFIKEDKIEKITPEVTDLNLDDNDIDGRMMKQKTSQHQPSRRLLQLLQDFGQCLSKEIIVRANVGQSR